ncbi:amidohydrolase family protein [Luteimonas sp. SJ-92]|uniref:Amidohydrolase family protein n=1 Tax=Luteimonas salinisoli TaxID=2752307 RepID=A0A853J9X6_9GAMM|nr:amidohydrolase family protein [Luteimonas salinisoli]NZA25582.1 amidohydrolase family protein [Luteimonas salinisoli]
MSRKLLPLVFLLFAGAVLAGESRHTVLLLGGHAGEQSLSATDGGIRAEYRYSDRGRGESLVATWRLDDAGLPVEYRVEGHDYMKAPVEESFRVEAGTASWRSRSGTGSAPVGTGAFYVPESAPPELTGVLARALLLAPGRRLPLLPSGEARLEEAGEIGFERDGAPHRLRQYRIHGLGFSPTPVWLDQGGGTAAIVGGWLSALAPGWESAYPRLLAEQRASDETEAARLARRLTHRDAGELLIRDVRLFDPRDLSVVAGSSVLVRGERIVEVASGGEIAPPPGAAVVEGGGRFLMPGLWDNHQHFGDSTGILDLLAGVTTARDLANDNQALLARVARIDAGTELGPRILRAGIIDGPGPYAGPTPMLAADAARAREIVDWYAAHGYGQIKIYSSLDPALVEVVAQHAHARGLRVSGHVPAGMSARQFVAAGADEIQHINFLVLDLLSDRVTGTRDMARFTEVAAHAHAYPPDHPAVRELLAILAHRGTVLDPTLNIYEAMFGADPAAPPPALAAVVGRFPPQVARQQKSRALEVPEGEEEAYAQALPALMALLKAAHEAGIPIVAGTDSLAGYSLHHELELYARAGIPAAEVLRIATLTPAEAMGSTADLGAIAPGRYADMLLIDGDPIRDVGDLRRIDAVFKGGDRYDPAELERALGIAPSAAARR